MDDKKNTGTDNSPSLLRRLLVYTPSTGKIVWKVNRGPVLKAGSVALNCVDSDGYLCGSVNYKKVRAHRVAWALHYGDWPKNQIDHINGIRSDNRIDNLRDVTQEENLKNCKINSKNTSGQMGVCFIKKTGKWQAEIISAGQKKFLGVFMNKESAILVRRKAERENGFHANHGKVLEGAA